MRIPTIEDKIIGIVVQSKILLQEIVWADLYLVLDPFYVELNSSIIGKFD